MVTGADLIVQGLAASGVNVCFANPGTSEVHLVRALDSAASIRACLALHENVVTGAADGYGRMTGRPAMALMHLGVGIANGIANLHNARRAHSPVVAVVGQHATWHRAADSPIASDIAALANVVSLWVREPATADHAGQDACDAVTAAIGRPRGVSTLIVPIDVQSAPARQHDLDPATVPAEPALDSARVNAAADVLRAGSTTVLWLGGSALSAEGLRIAAGLSEASGCKVYTETHAALTERGGGIPSFPSVPYFPEHAVVALSGVSAHVLVGMRRPVYMFGTADGISSPIDRGDVVVDLSSFDARAVLEALASALGPLPRPAPTLQGVEGQSGRLDPKSAGVTVARLLPADAIVVDESGTSGGGYQTASSQANRHTRLGITGGAIGMGLPVAIGAAVACPGRRVIALEADGSGLYTVQALWTMARESLDITVVVLVNHRYAILGTEFARAGVGSLGPLASSLIDLSNPTIDWVRLAEAHGVPATRVATVEDLEAAFARSLHVPGPTLIEALVEHAPRVDRAQPPNTNQPKARKR
jgi:acetolactate synthase-1/2/3 large subunit